MSKIPMSEKEFIKKIDHIICPRKPITFDTKLGDNCIWDSLAAVCYLDFIEEETGVYYDTIPEDRRSAKTVRDLYKFYVISLEKGGEEE